MKDSEQGPEFVWIKLYIGQDDARPIVFKIKLSTVMDVHDLRNEIKKENANVLKDVDAPTLEVYPKQQQNVPSLPWKDGNTKALMADLKLKGDLLPILLPDDEDASKQECLIVLAPVSSIAIILPFVFQSRLKNSVLFQKPQQKVYQLTQQIAQKQIEFDEISLDKICPGIDISTTVERNTVHVGWKLENNFFEKKPIFMRQHLIEFHTKLDTYMKHPRHRHLYISGPPGCGKTTYCLFYFTRYILVNQNSRGLIVLYRASSRNEVMIIEGQCLRFAKSGTNESHMSSLIVDLIQREGRDAFDFVVFDGVQQNKDICQSISSAITNTVGTKTKLIMTSSLVFDIKSGDSTRGINGIDEEFFVNSWQLGDYEAAVKAKIFGLGARGRSRGLSYVGSHFGVVGVSLEEKVLLCGWLGAIHVGVFHGRAYRLGYKSRRT